MIPRHMLTPILLAPALAAWLSLAGAFAGEPAAGGAGGLDHYTPRQREILAELLTAAPAGRAGGGGGPWLLSSWDSEGGLEELAPLPGLPGNAAAFFRSLEETYPDERDSLADGGEDSRGVGALIRAAELSECRLSPDYYPVYDRLTARQPDFAVLRGYLEALRRRAARAEKAGRPAEAEEAIRAALLCGRHLAADRSSLLVYAAGLVCQLRGAQDYESFLRRSGRPEAAGAAGRLAGEIGQLLRLFHWKSSVALGEMAEFACLPAALRIARDDAEACWRKEAILRLGILRHGVIDGRERRVGRDRRFERQAEEGLSRAAKSDPLPDVRRLAVWAGLNVRPDSLRDLRHDFPPVGE